MYREEEKRFIVKFLIKTVFGIAVFVVGFVALIMVSMYFCDSCEAAEFADISGYIVSEQDALYIAQTLYGEASSDYIPKAEKAMVAWCILNRLDSGRYGSSVYAVVSAPGQFYGFRAGSNPPESLMEIARDVLRRYAAEQAGEENVGRVLPQGYYYFYGDGAHNYFHIGQGRGSFDFGLPNPYDFSSQEETTLEVVAEPVEIVAVATPIY